VIGAIFLDQGYRAAYKLFSRSLIDVQAWPDDNYKGRLQEVTQERFLSTPQYDIVGASGPGHRREYTAEVSFGNGVSGKGRGRTKRDAEQMAAREALAALGALDTPPAQDEVLEAVAHEARRTPANQPNN
jgi:ribonuclease-3